ncbi:MAG: hypothetical protein FJX77_01075 [Armatimonadetes bacterium]|nr:hypothetical protein [Armatimonadota bacterium]
MREQDAQTTALVRLAVHRFAGSPEDEQRYLELNFALDRAVERSLRYQDLAELFEEAASAAPAGESWAWRLAAGLAANLRGDSPAAVRCLEQAWSVLQRMGHASTAAASFLHSEMARAHYHEGHYGPGVESATRGLQLARAANSPLAEAYAHQYLGIISIRQRELAYGLRHLTAARALFERMNQRHGRARVLDGLAYLELEQGHYPAAREYLDQSLQIKESLRDLRGQALTSLNLARLFTVTGEYPGALRCLERARDLSVRVGDERNATLIRIQLGELHVRHGRPVQGREELLIARAMARQRDDQRLEAFACFTLAEAERQCGSAEGAREAITLACSYFPHSDDVVMRERSCLRRAMLEGEEMASEAVQQPLGRLRELEVGAPLADALFEVAGFLRERGDVQMLPSLHAEALDVAEPVQAEQLAALIRSQAESREGRAWVDAMLTVKRQKDRLEEAYRELRRAEQLREALVQMIVHDLKNPLAGITPWLYMAKEGDLSREETDEYLQTAIDECDYLLRLIEDMNDVGKVQHTGALELDRTPVAIRELVADVQRRLQGRAQDNGMTICVDDPLEEEELPLVPADRNKLRRVLENLVANAVKYGKPPEESHAPPEIRLAAVQEQGPGDGASHAIRVEVRDNGPGIPPAEAERVFEAYYQAEAGRKRKAGVGLGLAFARMVIEAHGGAIWTAPNPHGGTIFAFRLPLDTAP